MEFKLDLTEEDFESLDDPSMTVTGKDLSQIAGMLGPRKADGSLPDVDFLKLKKDSRAIDKGENIGFPFAGDAPDLGAFEYGLSSSSVSAPIVKRSGVSAKALGSAIVFDLQGRYLGTLPADLWREKSIVDVLRTSFRAPGVYLVRYGRILKRVNVK